MELAESGLVSLDCGLQSSAPDLKLERQGESA
jgi:hypothetical protein